MQADRDDRFSNNEETGRHSTQTLVTAIAVIILAGGAYLLMPGGEENNQDDARAVVDPDTERLTPTVTAAPPRPTPADAIAAAPDIPETSADVADAVEASSDVDAPDEPEVITPPTPEEIDQQLRNDIQAAGLAPSQSLGAAYDAPYLLDRGVSSLDQLARGLVPTRTSNLPRPSGSFKTSQEGADYAMSREGYRRYNGLVKTITSLPTGALATLFHQQRRLLQDSYAALGYPADALDNTLIAALDNIISAPTREQPPALVSKGALWAFADTQLEGASDLHKQLLRTGPENTEALQQWARQLRDALLKP